MEVVVYRGRENIVSSFSPFPRNSALSRQAKSARPRLLLHDDLVPTPPSARGPSRPPLFKPDQFLVVFRLCSSSPVVYFPNSREWCGNQHGFLLRRRRHHWERRSPQLSMHPPSPDPRRFFGRARCPEAEHPRVSLLLGTSMRGISRPPASHHRPQIGVSILALLVVSSTICMTHQVSFYRNTHLINIPWRKIFILLAVLCLLLHFRHHSHLWPEEFHHHHLPRRALHFKHLIHSELSILTVVMTDEDGDVRTEKRLAWTKDEDERLMSAWLYNSNDPINGNNKKSDQYWGDVARVYNNTTPKKRKRSVKQAKDHWHSLNKLVYQFHCCYTKASAIYASGQSDAQLLEKAYKFYEDDYKAQFHHYDCWKADSEWPKWRTYNEWLENTKKRKTSDAGEAGEDTSSPKDAEDIPRPIGTKTAKAERNGKGKSKEVAADMELLEKLVAAQAEGKKARSEAIEMRKRVSTEKLETARLSAETARLSALAAKDNMEAKKLDKEAEMMRAYRELLVQDTTGMTDEMRNEHVKTLKVMRERLFGV